MRRNGRKVQLLLSLVLVSASMILVSGCRKGGEGKGQSKAEPGVAVQHGETVLTIDKSAREKSGIIVAPLEGAFYREEFEAYGTVLRPDALIDVRSSYLAAKAAREKADAALDVSRKEYERLKELNADDRNVSDKTLQAAGAALVSHQADASASEEKLRTVEQTVMAQWSRVVAEWIFQSSPEFNRLTELKEVLILITLPADKGMEAAPASIDIQAQGPRSVSARFVSRFPVADQRTQGISLLYRAPSHLALIPGVNVRAVIPAGGKIKGIVIPTPAVVWLQGKAWVYVQSGPEHFIRREVPVRYPVKEGFFVTEGFSPEDKVVVQGAQILLSQESLSSRPSGGKGAEEDED